MSEKDAAILTVVIMAMIILVAVAVISGIPLLSECHVNTPC